MPYGEVEQSVMQSMESMLHSIETARELVNWVYPPTTRCRSGRHFATRRV